MKYCLLVICVFVSSCAIQISDTTSTPSAAVTASITHPPKVVPPSATTPPTITTVTPNIPETVNNPILTLQTDHPLNFQTLSLNGITVHLLSFDSSKYALHIADQQPGSKWTSTKNAVSALGGIAGINGGFFDPQGQPIGLVKSNGKSTGSWNTSSSLTSGVYQLSGGLTALKRNHSANRAASELLQTGPFLLENSMPVKGLSTRNPAQRSLLLWDGATHFAIAHTSSCTLAQLSSALESLPSSSPSKFALNLDGGRSCDFHVDSSVNGTPIQRGHWLKSQVRNYLVLKKK